MALVKPSNLIILLTVTLALFLHQSHASIKGLTSTESPSMNPEQSPIKKSSPSPIVPLSDDDELASSLIVPLSNDNEPASSPIVPLSNEDEPAPSPIVPLSNEDDPALSPIVPLSNEDEPPSSPIVPLSNEDEPALSPIVPLSNEDDDDDDQDDEELTPEYERFILACQKIMSKKCADQIVGNIYQDTKVSKTCCSHLVNMGPDCHSELLQRERSLPKSKKEKQKIVRKSEALFKKCELQVGPVKGKKYPKLPERRYRPGFEGFLKKCAEKVTEKCGLEVVQAIYGKDKDATKVDKKCCGRLMHMGEECHVEMVRRLKELPKNKGKKEREMVQKRSDMVWKQCKQIAN